ncbi:hypothetical protein [Comamonas jiangduensis]|nr:hypothetical protein [Comamonas jiangduensis]
MAAGFHSEHAQKQERLARADKGMQHEMYRKPLKMQRKPLLI